jgi:molecular chaperone DnaK
MIRRGCEAVGIDLGTTYSSLAYLDTQFVPCVVPDTSGHTVIPSVLYFDGQSIIVGETALELSKDRSERAVQFVKLQMGEEWRFEIDGQVHTPESLSAMILAHLVREAEPQIGPTRHAVITVPAWFTEKRRRATEQAGRIAGLRVLGTLNEPMAAALAYGLHRADSLREQNHERNILVYDLGGGTFDVTVMRITPNELVELATRGNRKLGGKDWDEALMKLALEDFERSPHRQDPAAMQALAEMRSEHPEPDAAKALHDLRLECERAKRRLSSAARTTIPVRIRGHHHSAEITRAQFEAATDALVQSTRMTVETALEDARLDWGRIDRVVLVGGSTHMPAVRQMLQQASGKPPDRGINPVNAVALGAAVYAHLLESGSRIQPVRLEEAKATAAPVAPPASSPAAARPDVRFVTAHGIGIRTRNDAGALNHVLIHRNAPVPARVSRRFRTRKDRTGPASGIRVVVTQGDTPDAELAEVLGTARITGIPANEPPGQPVEITLEFDSQSRLQLEAHYLSTGQRLTLDLDIPGGLREEQVVQYHDMLVHSGLIRTGPPPDLELVSLDDDDFDDDNPLLEPID